MSQETDLWIEKVTFCSTFQLCVCPALVHFSEKQQVFYASYYASLWRISIFSLVKKITGHESQYGSMVLLFPSEEREWRLPQGPLPEPVVTLRTKQWHGSHDRCQIMHHPFDWRLSPRGFGRANHGEIWDIMDTWLVKKVLKSRKTLLLWPCCVNQ